MRIRELFALIVITTGVSCNGSTPDKPNDVPTESEIPAPVNIMYTIVSQHPKDTGAYTQGLEFYNGKLYESTGDYSFSSLRITDWKTGKVEKKHMMGSEEVFGEGLTIFKNKIYQLTWTSNIVYVYDINDITKPVKTLQWPYEGWGLTNNGTDLIISDGSEKIYFVSPDDLSIRRTITVTSHKGIINAINELEYIDGFIYANVYGQNYIVKVDPANGHVVGIIILENLLRQDEVVPGRTDVLNGMAYDSTSNTMFVTGKRWPKLFAVKLN